MAKLGLRLARPALVEALAPHSFVAQDVDRDLYMVRRSDVSGVYERVEFAVAGRRDEAIVVTLAVAVVWNVVNQMRGLAERGGLREVCPDPDNSRVELSSVEEAREWAAKVGAIAPERARALAHEKGPALLQTTEVARDAAGQAFHTFVQPASDLRSIREAASPDQQRLIDNALSRPFAIPSEELRPLAETAIAALVRMGDPDVMDLGKIATTPSPDPRARLDQMLAVKHLAIWKVRLLIDLIGLA